MPTRLPKWQTNRPRASRVRRCGSRSTEPIRQALLPTYVDRPMESKIVKEGKKWMGRLLTGDPAVLEELVSACPGLERQGVRQLLRNIKKEKTTNKSSKSLKALEQLIIKSMNSRKDMEDF